MPTHSLVRSCTGLHVHHAQAIAVVRLQRDDDSIPFSVSLYDHDTTVDLALIEHLLILMMLIRLISLHTNVHSLMSVRLEHA